MATDPLQQPALVGIPQIAEIAGVGRSAVGNWRKRHPDFPAAKVQTPTGALFDLREVEDWLIEQGKMSQRAPASARLWGLADAARGLWRLDEFVTFSVSCLIYMEACARAEHTDTSDRRVPRPNIPAGAAWSDIRTRPPHEFLRALTHGARAIEASNPELIDLLDPGLPERQPEASSLAYQVAFALEAATDPASPRFVLFEGLDELETLERSAGEWSTPGDVSRLVARLADFRGGTILDPAVGKGDLLLRTAFPDRDSPSDTRVVGIDINPDTTRRARSRFYLLGRNAEIRTENALTADPQALPMADTVVLDPPYGLGNWGHAELYVDERWHYGPPPPNSADFAWLHLAASHLKPAGRAAVVLGIGTLTRSGREGAIRRTMVEAGIVEAVVVLPPRLRTNTSIALAVWLLRSPGARVATEDVLLVDGSELGASGRSQFSLPEPSVDRLAALVTRWRNTGELSTADAAIAGIATIDQIVAAEVSLDPRRYRSQPNADLSIVRDTAQTLRGSLKESSVAAGAALEELLAYLEGRP